MFLTLIITRFLKFHHLLFRICFANHDMIKKITIIIFLLIFATLFLQNCDTTEPPISNQISKTIKLELIDVSCTEAFIGINAKDSILPINMFVYKNDKEIDNFILTKTDTAFIDTTLKPNEMYTYQVFGKMYGDEEKSDTLQVNSLNITSDLFTWETETFGENNNGVLYDVCLINDDNIWAVGEIYSDTSETLYNAVHWDGNSWKLKKIYFDSECSTVEYPPIKSIFAFDSDNILITNGGNIGFFDGENLNVDCAVNQFLTGAINKIWGTSTEDFYAVGNEGNIVHYINGHWKKLDSKTNLNLNDIWGTYKNGEKTIMVVGGNVLENADQIILQIKTDDTVEQINENGIFYPLGSVWFNNNFKFYIGGSGVFSKFYNNQFWSKNISGQYYIYSIRGNGLNDIIACGGLGFISHFNGITWTDNLLNENENNIGNIYSSVFKGNKYCGVGTNINGKAVIVTGVK